MRPPWIHPVLMAAALFGPRGGLAAPGPAESFLQTYCVSCHGPTKKKGSLDVTALRPDVRSVDAWRGLAERVDTRDMPPEGERQPAPAERAAFVGAMEDLERSIFAGAPRDPGRVTVRRLNRTEYDNTVRDLFGIDLRPSANFPSDDVGYGFDNIGDVLTLPPVLVERYLDAARGIAEQVIAGEPSPPFRRVRFEATSLTPSPPGSRVRGGTVVLSAGGTLSLRHPFPASGEYTVTIAAWREGAGRPSALVRIDGEELASLTLRGKSGKPPSTRARVDQGTRRVEVAFPGGEARVAIDAILIEGPHAGARVTLPASHALLVPADASAARAAVTAFVRRAYRRPPTNPEVDRLVAMLGAAMAKGASLERAMQLVVQAALVSPHFLFRVEADRRPPFAARQTGTEPLGDWELASRLSYFLWSSMPDERLFAAAAAGRLRDPAVLAAEARRMLTDPRARALVTGFGDQWLELRAIDSHQPSRRHFPEFDDELRGAMLRETQLFFEEVLREDLPLVTFLDADFTYVNQRLARHYGLPGIEGDGFRRVRLADRERGGILGHASILMLTSNPTRTSPVKRGRWVLEQILGTPPPPPPPGVPELPESARPGEEAAKTMRALLEAHSRDPNCAGCHRKMDPLGFGLERFDAVGALRTHDGDAAVDATGVLPDGTTFSGATGMKAVLLQKQDAFRRALVTKMLTFALGRGTEGFDRPTIDEISARVKKDGDRFSSLVVEIVKSVPFGKRRESGEER